MLYDEPILFFRGLTIYKDFSDPRTFYYLPPESPRIARSAEGGESGDYALRLVLFRPDPNGPKAQGMEDGGGFLNLDTDLHLNEATLQEVRQEIQRKFGTDANLVPVPFIDGSVQLVLLGVGRTDEAEPFVRKVAGSTVPSLYGSERAAFSVVLDRNGAAIMKSVIEKGGITMAMVIYDLTYAGIGPAYNLKITIDYQRVFDHLEMRLRAGVSAGNSKTSLVARAGFHMLVEELKETRAIKVEEVDPIPGENGRTPTNQEAINEIIGNLMGSKWFKPTLSNAGSMTDLTGLVGENRNTGSGSGSGGTGSGSGSGPASGTGTGAPRTGTGATPATTGTGATPATTGTGAPRTATTGTGTGTGTSGPGTSATTTRATARWDVDARENLTGDRGVEEPFQASSSGTDEALIVKGTGATATVDGQAVTLQGNRLVVPVADGTTRNVVITWPAQTEVRRSAIICLSVRSA